ncbi:hypothetical protein [Natronoglycomyces albus]|uniref:tRNA nuclease CdiA C-terminal domain-containing protein n=1 Tax=Natronoglycomyces albus TaxID=2811108 RepID=A0A895XN99_9ACTN|nr:hypothetical protein [Natronoglycomyces albus]QSB04869.1 hypothetical protein JQS30_14040 [Natronoglycomyces albus]
MSQASAAVRIGEGLHEVLRTLTTISSDLEALEKRAHALIDHGITRSTSGSVPLPRSPLFARGAARRGNSSGKVEKQRSLRRQSESANVLSTAGYDVDQSPPTNPAGKNPDFNIEGRDWDCYAPSSGKLATIRRKIRTKVKTEQADSIIVNLSDSEVSSLELQQKLRQDPVTGLREVKAIENGRVVDLDITSNKES